MAKLRRERGILRIAVPKRKCKKYSRVEKTTHNLRYKLSIPNSLSLSLSHSSLLQILVLANFAALFPSCVHGLSRFLDFTNFTTSPTVISDLTSDHTALGVSISTVLNIPLVYDIFNILGLPIWPLPLILLFRIIFSFSAAFINPSRSCCRSFLFSANIVTLSA